MDQMTLARLENLEKANSVRVNRAKDKKRITAGKLSASAVLRNPPHHWQKATVADLLLSIDKVGRVKANKWCKYSFVRPGLIIEDLTQRQRNSLADHIDIWIDRRDELRRAMETTAA
jgi:hypothetical protein